MYFGVKSTEQIKLFSLIAVAIFLQGRAQSRHSEVNIFLRYTHGWLDTKSLKLKTVKSVLNIVQPSA